MPGNFKRNDLRVVKTYKAILSALSVLLNKQNFNKITVNNLCEEARISRTAFYMHFLDKYDLLRYFLNKIKEDYDFHLKDNDAINSELTKKHKIIVNLVEEADYITMAILQDFVLAVANVPIDKDNEFSDNKNIVLTNFCAGGILNFILWQIKNGFPINLQMANPYISEILLLLKNWGEPTDKKL